MLMQSKQAQIEASELNKMKNQAFTPLVYEIHGNVNFMHCSDEESQHGRQLLSIPSLTEADAFEKSYSN
jgi:hypothetical protein